MYAQNKAGWHKCPCCGYFTLSEGRGNSFEICPVCFWEDDGLQWQFPAMAGGANAVSLQEARAIFQQLGASEACFLRDVRPPQVDELPNE